MMNEKKNIWSENEETLQELRKSEERFRVLFDSSLDAILLSEPNGEIFTVNNSACTIFGRTEEEIKLVGRNGIIDSSDPRLGIALEERSRKGSFKCELTGLRKDGTTFPIEISSTLFRNINGIAQSNMIIRDISEYKRMEKSLKESETHLKSLIEGIKDYAIYLLDTNGYITSWNAGAERINGFTSEEVIGKPFSLLFTTEDQENNKPQKLLEVAKTMGRMEEEGIRIRKDGSRIWVNAIISALRNEDGSLYGFVKITRDITERRWTEKEIKLLSTELEQRVVQRTAQLELANKELEAFSYSVSHDLRAPLRHASGYVELLADRFKDILPEKGRHYLDALSDSVHQMGKLIDDLLQFSKSGRIELSKSVLNMNKIVEEVKMQLQEENPTQNVKWVIKILPSVSGDEAMLRLVWINLLSNAIKFTRTREISIIEISAVDENMETIFSVRDNGVGFDMQYAQKLFGIFQRLHPIEEFEGTGIGLANVQRIISRHGGRTWAHAELDKGAIFYFSIPK